MIGRHFIVTASLLAATATAPAVLGQNTRSNEDSTSRTGSLVDRLQQIRDSLTGSRSGADARHAAPGRYDPHRSAATRHRSRATGPTAAAQPTLAQQLPSGRPRLAPRGERSRMAAQKATGRSPAPAAQASSGHPPEPDAFRPARRAQPRPGRPSLDTYDPGPSGLPGIVPPPADRPTAAKDLDEDSQPTSDAPSVDLGRQPHDGQPTDTPRLADTPRVATPPRAKVARPQAEASRRVAATPVDSTGQRGDNLLFSQEAPYLNTRVTGPSTVSVGTPARYQITIANLGNAEAQQLVAEIHIPVWAAVSETKASTGTAQVQPASGQSHHGNDLHWELGQLNAGGREHLDVVLVPQRGEPLELAVTNTYDHPSSRTVIEVQEPKLHLVVSGPDEVLYGETKRYELVLSNPGTGPAENVVLQLLQLGGGSRVADMHKVGTLPAGATRQIEVEFVARQSGTVVVKARAEARGSLKSEVAKEVFVRRPGLEVEIEGPQAAYTGTLATYKVHVSNPGSATAQSVSLSASLPRGADYVDATDGGRFVSDEGKVTWHIGGLPADTDRIFELRCLLRTPDKNRLEILAEAESDLSDAAAMSTDVLAVADLTLNLIDPSGPVAVNGEATYKVLLYNRGTKRAQNIDVVAFFSDGVEPISAEGTAHEIRRGQVAFATIANLEAGGKLTLKIRAKATRIGNHVCRTEVVCESTDTRLAAEETTRFYGSDMPASSPIVERTESDSSSSTANLPTPASELR